MTKAPTPTEKLKQQRDNTQTPPKTSITQRLRTDLGRLIETWNSLNCDIIIENRCGVGVEAIDQLTGAVVQYM